MGTELVFLENWIDADPIKQEGKGIVTYPRDAWLNVDGVTYFNHTVKRDFLPELDWEESEGPFSFEGGNTIPLRDCRIVLINGDYVDSGLKTALRERGLQLYEFGLSDGRHLDFHINGTPETSDGRSLVYTKSTYDRNRETIHDILDQGFEPVQVDREETNLGAPNFISIYGEPSIIFVPDLTPRTNDRIRRAVGEEHVVEVGGDMLECLAEDCSAGLRCVSNEVYE